MSVLSKILKEWKTYILVITLIGSGLLNHYELIDEKLFDTVATTLIGLISASVIHKQRQIEKRTEMVRSEFQKASSTLMAAEETTSRQYEQLKNGLKNIGCKNIQ